MFKLVSCSAECPEFLEKMTHRTCKSPNTMILYVYNEEFKGDTGLDVCDEKGDGALQYYYKIYDSMHS